jgi:hypothetical protein
MIQDIRKAILWSWLIVSASLLLILAAVFIIPDRTVLSWSASVQVPHQDGAACLLCGMTRAFLALSHGLPGEAMWLNPWSVPLFGCFLANGIVAITFLTAWKGVLPSCLGGPGVLMATNQQKQR